VGLLSSTGRGFCASYTQRVRRDRLILEAAEEQFYARSFDGVGVAAIGAQAGVTPSAIYRHFQSKDEILAVLLEHAIDALQKHTSKTFDNPQELLAYLIAGQVDFAVAHQRLAAIWTRERYALVEPYRQQVERRHRVHIDRWVDCLEACYPGRSRPDVLAVVRALQALIVSDSSRPQGAQRSRHLREMLIGIATTAVAGLATKESVQSTQIPAPESRG
jgi:AcrR family transcriptional regulator